MTHSAYHTDKWFRVQDEWISVINAFLDILANPSTLYAIKTSKDFNIYLAKHIIINININTYNTYGYSKL